MKIVSTFDFFVLLMVLLTFGMPFATLAQQLSVQEEATKAAEKDAVDHTNQNVWRLFGCVGGVLGVAGSYVYEPPPPASALLGKSPEYVAFYTDAYTLKTKNIQTRGAIEGCAVSTLAIGAFYGLRFIIATVDNPLDPY